MAANLGYLLKQAQYGYRQRMDEALRPLDLTAAQYGVLAALRRQPEKTNADLARMCFVTPQTMIQILAGLQRRGLVRRRPHPAHGRLVQTALTPGGEALADRADEIAQGVERWAFGGLTEADREHLASALTACVRGLAAGPD
jgi:DNA-binding MarR family transcriptional regulator